MRITISKYNLLFEGTKTELSYHFPGAVKKKTNFKLLSTCRTPLLAFPSIYAVTNLKGIAKRAALVFSLSDLLGPLVLIRANAASFAAEFNFDCCLRFNLSTIRAALVCELTKLEGLL